MERMSEVHKVNQLGLPQYDVKTKSVNGHLKKKGRYTWSMRWVCISIDIANDQNYELAYASKFSKNFKSKRSFSLARATLTKDKDHMFMIELADGKCLLFACINESEVFRWVVSLQYIIEVAGQRAEYFTQQHQRQLNYERSQENFKDAAVMQCPDRGHHGDQPSPQEQKSKEEEKGIPASIDCETNDSQSTLTLPSFDPAETPLSKAETLSLFSPAALRPQQQVNYPRYYHKIGSTIATDKHGVVGGDEEEVSPMKDHESPMIANFKKLLTERSVPAPIIRQSLQRVMGFAITVVLLALAFIVSFVGESIMTVTVCCFGPALIIGERGLSFALLLVGIRKRG